MIWIFGVDVAILFAVWALYPGFSDKWKVGFLVASLTGAVVLFCAFIAAYIKVVLK